MSQINICSMGTLHREGTFPFLCSVIIAGGKGHFLHQKDIPFQNKEIDIERKCRPFLPLLRP
jgi:hypothetical protein